MVSRLVAGPLLWRVAQRRSNRGSRQWGSGIPRRQLGRRRQAVAAGLPWRSGAIVPGLRKRLPRREVSPLRRKRRHESAERRRRIAAVHGSPDAETVHARRHSASDEACRGPRQPGSHTPRPTCRAVSVAVRLSRWSVGAREPGLRGRRRLRHRGQAAGSSLRLKARCLHGVSPCDDLVRAAASRAKAMD